MCDVNTCFKFGNDRFMGLGSVYTSDFNGRHDNSFVWKTYLLYCMHSEYSSVYSDLVRSMHSTTLPNVPSPSVRTTLSVANKDN